MNKTLNPATTLTYASESFEAATAFSQHYGNTFPLVAILRGASHGEIPALVSALLEVGLTSIEVPLMSTSSVSSLQALTTACTPKQPYLIGAGTVICQEQVDIVKKSQANFLVMPHCDAPLIRYAKQQDLICMPGVMTPSEAFQALAAGADALKWFPAGSQAPSALQALKTVLPADVAVYAVGGITLDNMQAYYQAGASGFGLGSCLYKPGDSSAAVKQKALAFRDKWQAISH